MKVLLVACFALLALQAHSQHPDMVLKYSTYYENTISLPLRGTVDVMVSWGDGHYEYFNYPGLKTHTYTTKGEYTVSISGKKLQGFGSDSSEFFQPAVTTNASLKQVVSFGNLGTTSLRGAFANAIYLESVPASLPSTVTDISYMFSGCTSFNQDISSWDISRVTNTSYLFSRAYFYNQPLDNWNTSAVTNMAGMFNEASNFNQPLGKWDVSNVVDMHEMFWRDTSFNQPIGNWNTSSAVNMSALFAGARRFNQPIGSWNTSAVTNMSYMFADAKSFNQPIGNWDVSKVIGMFSMFAGAAKFNQPIGNWNTSSVVIMSSMFGDMTSDMGAISFNQPIGNWNTSKVEHMYYMFSGATAFNQPIGNWDVSAVTHIYGMFWNATAFNQPLNAWNVSNVQFMDRMFDHAVRFNQPLDLWRTDSVREMNYLFSGALAFNQPIGSWNVGAVDTMDNMFTDVHLSIENYENLLLGWSSQKLKKNITFSGDKNKYASCVAKLAKEKMINTFQWKIRDGGLVTNNCVVTSLEEHVLKPFVLAYPNPASTLLHIPYVADNEYVTLYNTQGEAFILTTQNQQINISAFPPGFYLLKTSKRQQTVAIE